MSNKWLILIDISCEISNIAFGFLSIIVALCVNKINQRAMNGKTEITNAEKSCMYDWQILTHSFWRIKKNEIK